MKKVIALGGSNSKTSINKQLAIYVANQIKNSETIVADLNDFELPLYGIDLEKDKGIPEGANKLNTILEESDALVVSMAEHNGSYAAAFKNAIDWLSRIDQKVWKNKPMLLMATSPGGRGGATVLHSAAASFPYLGANIVAQFSLPSFHDNYSDEGLNEPDLNLELKQKIQLLQEAI